METLNPQLNLISREPIREIRKNLHLGKITRYTIEAFKLVLCSYVRTYVRMYAHVFV